MQKLDEIGWGTIFEENPILMLRFVRYAAEYGEELDGKLKTAILQKNAEIAKAGKEEIEKELRGILVSPHPDKLRFAYELGLSRYFLPEFDAMMETEQANPHHKYSVGEHTLRALLGVAPQYLLRYAMLLHDVGKPLTKSTDEQGIDHFYEHYLVGKNLAVTILRRLGLDELSIQLISTLIEWHDYRWESPGSIKKEQVLEKMKEIGEDLVLALIWVQRADILAQSSFKQQDKLAILERVEGIYYELLTQKNETKV